MRVYTKIVLSAGGDVELAEWEHVRGPIALAEDDDPDPIIIQAPGISQEERDLIQKQIQALDEQLRIAEQAAQQNELLQPFLYDQLGLSPVQDEEGNIVGFEEKPDAFAAQRARIEKGFLDRTEQALRGELPIDSATKRELTKTREREVERLTAQLGPDFMNSTAGREAMDRLEAREALIRDASSRGDLTVAEQIQLVTQSQNQQLTLGEVAGLSGVASSPLQGAGAFGAAALGLQSPLSAFQFDRGLQTNVALQNAALQQRARESQGSLMAGIIGLGGGIAQGITGTERFGEFLFD